MRASRNAHVEVVKVLLQNGANFVRSNTIKGERKKEIWRKKWMEGEKGNGMKECLFTCSVSLSFYF
jgi:hypothetical protein